MPRVTTADTSVGALGVGSRVPVIATLAANPATPLAGGRTIVMTCRSGKCCASGTQTEPASFSYGYGGSLTAIAYGVAYGNGRWVAGGYVTDLDTYQDAMVLTATDPTGSWTAISNPLGDSGFDYNEVDSVTFADGTFVLGGLAMGYPTIAYSTDGSSWTAVDLGMTRLQAYGPAAIAYGAGTWMAVMRRRTGGTGTYVAYASSLDGPWTVDLQTWRLVADIQAHAADYGDGVFTVADNYGGKLWSAASPAGPWTSETLGIVSGIVYGNDGRTVLSYASTGAFDVDATPGEACWLKVRYITTNGYYAETDDAELAIDNGTSPTDLRNLWAVAYGDGKYVVVGERWNEYPTNIDPVALVFACG